MEGKSRRVEEEVTRKSWEPILFIFSLKVLHFWEDMYIYIWALREFHFVYATK